MSIVTHSPEIPYGYCQCGCGQLTRISKWSNSSQGTFKDQPVRYVKGHENRGRCKPVERIWALIDSSAGPDACWPWTGAVNNKGYGSICINGIDRPATQVVWELSNGRPFPDGQDAMHSCDNPPCCNPAHISPGTRSGNMQDASFKGRLPIGSSHWDAKLTEANIPEIRQMRIDGMTVQAIATRFDVSRRAIRAAVTRETWRHVP